MHQYIITTKRYAKDHVAAPLTPRTLFMYDKEIKNNILQTKMIPHVECHVNCQLVYCIVNFYVKKVKKEQNSKDFQLQAKSL